LIHQPSRALGDPNSENNVVVGFRSTGQSSRDRTVWLVGRAPVDTRTAPVGQADKSELGT
ncbi:hypothetical protein, partial [Spirosoma daeguense]